jgi:predicted ATP-dependent protease
LRDPEKAKRFLENYIRGDQASHSGIDDDLKKLKEIILYSDKDVSPYFDSERVNKVIKPLIKLLKVQNPKGYSDSQLQAINIAAKQRLSIIQGPPGTGKTEVVQAISFLFSTLNENSIKAFKAQQAMEK